MTNKFVSLVKNIFSYSSFTAFSITSFSYWITFPHFKAVQCSLKVFWIISSFHVSFLRRRKVFFIIILIIASKLYVVWNVVFTCPSLLLFLFLLTVFLIDVSKCTLRFLHILVCHMIIDNHTSVSTLLQEWTSFLWCFFFIEWSLLSIKLIN